MHAPPPFIRHLTPRLVAASAPSSSAGAHPVVLVTERLRRPLARISGPEGFESLLRRANALAAREAAALQNVRIATRGAVELTDAAPDDPGIRAQAAAAILAHFLGLLVAFIGEPLTLGMILEAWPELAADPDFLGNEDNQ